MHVKSLGRGPYSVPLSFILKSCAGANVRYICLSVGLCIRQSCFRLLSGPVNLLVGRLQFMMTVLTGGVVRQ